MHVTTLTVLLVGYLLGSIPFAYLLARRHRGIDLRMAGSGNVGAANLLRTTTKKIGVSAMALDMGKGIASVLVARQIEPGAAAPTIAGIAAVLGHIYPVWIGFKGGKGVATTCGVFAVLAPREPIRLVGVRVEGLAEAGDSPRQLALGERDRGWRDAELAADAAAARFGRGAVRPASLLGAPDESRNGGGPAREEITGAARPH